MLGWSALPKLYPEILRWLLSEEMVQSRYVSLIQIKSYLNIELYASREVTLAQLWARRLFPFQWHQEKESSLLFFGSGLDSTTPFTVKAKKGINKSNKQVRISFAILRINKY